MKRWAIIAVVATAMLWNASPASAQYRPHTAHNHTMSGHNHTMTGHLQTNHNHLVPRPVTSYSQQYTGVVPGGVSPYSSGAVILPTSGTPLGASLFPAPNSYNPSIWTGSVYPSGGFGSTYGGAGWPRGR